MGIPLVVNVNKKALSFSNLSSKSQKFEKIKEDFLFNSEIKETSKMDKDPNTPMRGIPMPGRLVQTPGIPMPGRQVPGVTTSTPARTSTIPLVMSLDDSDDEDGGEEGGEESGDEDEVNNEEEDKDKDSDDDEEGDGEEDSADDEEGEEEEDENAEEGGEGEDKKV